MATKKLQWKNVKGGSFVEGETVTGKLLKAERLKSTAGKGYYWLIQLADLETGELINKTASDTISEQISVVKKGSPCRITFVGTRDSKAAAKKGKDYSYNVYRVQVPQE